MHAQLQIQRAFSPNFCNHIDNNRSDDDHALDDTLDIGIHAKQRLHIVDNADDHRADQCAKQRARPPDIEVPPTTTAVIASIS